MKNLFEDIKDKTNFQEKSLEVIDIDDLKKDILELEQKIRFFKQFLRKEINSIQAEESILEEKSYKEIIPSPVRFMIKCPFKCVIIHQFQEFMKASPNRYGGWNEYNHNLFVQIWNKYNGNVLFTSKRIDDSHLFQEFIDEVFQKISDPRFEDIHSHIEWYSQYLNLKICQKKALDKWKENKIKIKKPLRDAKKYKSITHPINGVNGSVSGETLEQIIK
ncbi:coiled-coil domain-containing protein 112-like [Nymphalis io]|uniref:coiled-coil domain-containing protein 112-like n=1 Tax=Inachis io TaxID=171585 RepID=UPI0021692D0B|nr:coiled-coil domain-containing protein 112-like [Nymphalis io]